MILEHEVGPLIATRSTQSTANILQIAKNGMRQTATAAHAAYLFVQLWATNMLAVGKYE